MNTIGGGREAAAGGCAHLDDAAEGAGMRLRAHCEQQRPHKRALRTLMTTAAAAGRRGCRRYRQAGTRGHEAAVRGRMRRGEGEGGHGRARKRKPAALRDAELPHEMLLATKGLGS